MNNILVILMKWSLESKEYEMTKFLFKEMNVGIPVNYLYQLSTKSYFSSMDSFLSSEDVRKSNSIDFDELLRLFKESKYMKLEEWNNRYGYRFLQV